MEDTGMISRYALLIDSNKTLIKGISEGGFVNKKGKLEKKCGFEYYTYSDKVTGSVLKIRYHDNRNKNTYQTFYYKDNKLILALSCLEERQRDTIYHFEYFFSNDSLMAQTGELKKKKYEKRITTSQYMSERAYETLNAVFKVRRGDQVLIDSLKH